MKIIEINPINTYSCMFCGVNFESQEILSNFWFCSNSHKYKWAYRYSKSVFPKAKEESLLKLTKIIVGRVLNGKN